MHRLCTCAASVDNYTACLHRPQEAGATLRFGLTFGASPRVVFTFLRSYEQLGSVTIGFAAAGDEAGKRQSRNKVAGAVYEVDGIWGGEKMVVFAPFLYKNDHFAKTGSGQT